MTGETHPHDLLRAPAPDVSEQRRGRLTDLSYIFPARYRMVWVALIALLLLAASTADEVLREQSLVFITSLAGILAIASVGQGLVVIARGIDLSVASTMTLGGIAVVKVSESSNGRLAITLAVLVGIAVLIGLVNGLLIAVARINALIVTLAMSGVVTGATLWWAGTTFSSTGQVPPALSEFAQLEAGPISAIGLLGLVVAVVVALILRSTSLGQSFVASGTNARAAEIIGVRIRLHEVAAYVVAAVLYMLAGVLLAGYVTSPDYTLGASYLLSTIVAIALAGAAIGGGPASMVCILGAALFVPFLGQYLRVQGFSGGVQELVYGVILVLAVAMMTGTSGRRLRLPASLSAFRRSNAADGPSSTSG